MKFDYNIIWYDIAEKKLLNQVSYILEKSQNLLIAEQFYDAIKSDHCIYKLLTYIYFAKNNDNKSKELLITKSLAFKSIIFL